MFWKLLIFIGVLIVSLALVGVIPSYFVAVGVVLILAGLYVRARDRDWAWFNQRQTDRRNRREPLLEVPVSISFNKERYTSVPARGRRRWREPRELLQMP